MWVDLPVTIKILGTSTPFPEAVENHHLSVILKCDCKSEKYQLFLDISLGISPTVIASFIIDTANVS